MAETCFWPYLTFKPVLPNFTYCILVGTSTILNSSVVIIECWDIKWNNEKKRSWKRGFAYMHEFFWNAAHQSLSERHEYPWITKIGTCWRFLTPAPFIVRRENGVSGGILLTNRLTSLCIHWSLLEKWEGTKDCWLIREMMSPSLSMKLRPWL
jgi:hypothetical protein